MIFTQMQNLIHLTEQDYIGKGLHRKCYHHPADLNRCIKINYNDGAEEETNREIAYYKHLIKRNIEWLALPQYYGTISTNYGQGQVFELIRDYNGQISTSLEHYLAEPQLTEQYYDALILAMRHLKSALLKDRIITMTIKSKNILFQQHTVKQNRLIIIDNIGNSTFIPIANYISLFAVRKIERTWQRFLKSIIKENANNKWISQLVQAINSN